MELTPTEERLNTWLNRYPEGHQKVSNAVHVIKSILREMERQGVSHEVLAVSACIQLGAVLSLYKMKTDGDPTLVDILLDDLINTVRNRTFPGETELRTKQ